MPSPRLPSKIARLMGTQMVATIVVLVLVWAFCLYHTRPNHPVETTGGIDATNTIITWIAFTIVILALCLVHLILARQLFGEAKGVRRDIRSW
jgi:heme/copper-type cytochrome/quinol oxidase subunit 2